MGELGAGILTQQAGRLLHRFNHLGVAGAAAEISRKRVADFLRRRIGIVVEQGLGRHQHAGAAEAALQPAAVLESLLDRVQPLAFEKFGLRKGQALALVNAAASFWVDGKKSAFAAPRIALGAVAPTVIRTPKAEAYLAGRKISAEAMAEAGRIAATEAKPISDFRASAEYRRDLVAVLVKRALANSLARATAKDKELVA